VWVWAFVCDPAHGGLMAGWLHGWMHGCMDGCMDGWTDAWMHGCMDGWMHAWMACFPLLNAPFLNLPHSTPRPCFHTLPSTLT
jgi:hypothetical protein